MVKILFFLSSIAAAAGREPANWPELVPSPPRIEEHSGQDGKRFPRLWFGSVRWERPLKPITMEVDDDLSPISIQRYTFQVLPQLRTSENQIRDLPDGFYVMRMVVLRPTHPAEDGDLATLEKKFPGTTLYRRYIASTERIVQVTQGSVRATVEFRFRAISSTVLANTLLIQILPVQSQSLTRAKNGLVVANSSYELDPRLDFETNVISIPFIPRLTQNLATPPTPVQTNDVSDDENLDLGTFSIRAESYQRRLNQQRSATSPVETAKNLKLKYLALDSSAIPSNLSRALRSSKDGIGEEFAMDLCRLLTESARVDPRLTGGLPAPQLIRTEREFRQMTLNKCALKPEQALQLVRQTHVHEMENKFQELGGAPARLALTLNFATNRQHSTDTSSSIQQLFNPVDIMGVLRLGYTYSVSQANSRSKLEGTLVSGGADIDIHHWDMAITLNRYTECTIIKAKPNKAIWGFFDRMSGLYVCNRESNVVTKKSERYYHIFPTVPTSPTLDLFDPKNQIVNVVLRSQSEYFRFIKAIHKFIRPNQSEAQNPATLLKEAGQDFILSPTVQPFVLSQPLPLTGAQVERRQASKDSPGFFERFLHQYEEEF